MGRGKVGELKQATASGNDEAISALRGREGASPAAVEERQRGVAPGVSGARPPCSLSRRAPQARTALSRGSLVGCPEKPRGHGKGGALLASGASALLGPLPSPATPAAPAAPPLWSSQIARRPRPTHESAQTRPHALTAAHCGFSARAAAKGSNDTAAAHRRSPAQPPRARAAPSFPLPPPKPSRAAPGRCPLSSHNTAATPLIPATPTLTHNNTLSQFPDPSRAPPVERRRLGSPPLFPPPCCANPPPSLRPRARGLTQRRRHRPRPVLAGTRGAGCRSHRLSGAH
jgi:hypothetical protein